MLSHLNFLKSGSLFSKKESIPAILSLSPCDLTIKSVSNLICSEKLFPYADLVKFLILEIEFFGKLSKFLDNSIAVYFAFPF